MHIFNTEPFPVRYYEIDPYGHVNHAHYVRWMQEAAFQATADAGYALDRYARMGRVWLVHDTRVSYRIPLHYGDRVTVRTFIMDFRRIRSRRAYEIRNADTGELAATGITDWVFVDTDSRRPAQVPDEVISAFWPNGGPEPPEALPGEKPHHERFPTPPDPPTGAVTIEVPIPWRDIDSMQHVSNANYLAYMEEAGWQAPGVFGWPMERIRDELGLGIFMKDLRIQYIDEIRYGDTVQVTTFLANVRRATSVRWFLLRRASDGELITRANARFAFVNMETGRPMRVPDVFYEDFKEHIVE